MSQSALIVWGGWEGHRPQQCAQLVQQLLTSEGLTVESHNSLDIFADLHRLIRFDLIVPIWTMGQMPIESHKNLRQAVAEGTGLAGFHGGMGDTFRDNPFYKWMVGGQWVAHPGDIWPSYTVNITNHDHPVTRGLNDFKLQNTERYYMHIDPSIEVLATITFEEIGVVMPYVWTRLWDKGRIFYAAWGHSEVDFDGYEAREILRRGMLWSCRKGTS